MKTIEAIVFEPVGCFARFPDAHRDAAAVPAYEDVAPALAELKALGVRLMVASSLPDDVLTRFLDASGLSGVFEDVRAGDSTRESGATALRGTLASAAITADRTLFITDSAEGLQIAREAGVHGILMMNDPDEAMKLTAHNPAGGIVSLLELPDFVRFVTAGRGR